MNQAQRNVPEKTLWIVALGSVALVALAVYTDSRGEKWWLFVPPVAVVAALYLRSGGKK